MVEPSRIEQLRRRVQVDPASIAFAALAEEYRRGGWYQEAIETCRTGLRRHPSYLSPRVTLGRALLALGHRDDARAELERVLQAAPDNLAARCALEEIEAAPPGSPVEAPAAPDPALPAFEAFLAAIQRALADTPPAAAFPPADR